MAAGSLPTQTFELKPRDRLPPHSSEALVLGRQARGWTSLRSADGSWAWLTLHGPLEAETEPRAADAAEGCSLALRESVPQHPQAAKGRGPARPPAGPRAAEVTSSGSQAPGRTRGGLCEPCFAGPRGAVSDTKVHSPRERPRGCGVSQFLRPPLVGRGVTSGDTPTLSCRVSPAPCGQVPFCREGGLASRGTWVEGPQGGPQPTSARARSAPAPEGGQPRALCPVAGRDSRSRNTQPGRSEPAGRPGPSLPRGPVSVHSHLASLSSPRAPRRSQARLWAQ